jgi:hypothetical protein
VAFDVNSIKKVGARKNGRNQTMETSCPLLLGIDKYLNYIVNVI